MFSLPTTVTVSGTEYPVRTDFRVILEIFVMLEDPDLNDRDKTEALLRMFYEDRPPAQDAEEALRAFLDFLEPNRYARRKLEEEPSEADLLRKRTRSGVSELSEPAREARRYGACKDVIRWEHDFPLIVGPVNHVLGMECRSAPYLHWYTFLAAYMDMDPGCIFAQVLRIREKLRTGKKLEKWERDFLRQNPDLIQPPVRFTEAEKALLKDWA